MCVLARDSENQRLTTTSTTQGLPRRVFRLSWLGQTAASFCWIVSMMAYGIDTTGDWLQLSAASAWLLANIATLLAPEND